MDIIQVSYYYKFIWKSHSPQTDVAMPKEEKSQESVLRIEEAIVLYVFEKNIISGESVCSFYSPFSFAGKKRLKQELCKAWYSL